MHTFEDTIRPAFRLKVGDEVKLTSDFGYMGSGNYRIALSPNGINKVFLQTLDGKARFGREFQVQDLTDIKEHEFNKCNDSYDARAWKMPWQTEQRLVDLFNNHPTKVRIGALCKFDYPGLEKEIYLMAYTGHNRVGFVALNGKSFMGTSFQVKDGDNITWEEAKQAFILDIHPGKVIFLPREAVKLDSFTPQVWG